MGRRSLAFGILSLLLAAAPDARAGTRVAVFGVTARGPAAVAVAGEVTVGLVAGLEAAGLEVVRARRVGDGPRRRARRRALARAGARFVVDARLEQRRRGWAVLGALIRTSDGRPLARVERRFRARGAPAAGRALAATLVAVLEETSAGLALGRLPGVGPSSAPPGPEDARAPDRSTDGERASGRSGGRARDRGPSSSGSVGRGCTGADDAARPSGLAAGSDRSEAPGGVRSEEATDPPALAADEDRRWSADGERAGSEPGRGPGAPPSTPIAPAAQPVAEPSRAAAGRRDGRSRGRGPVRGGIEIGLAGGTRATTRYGLSAGGEASGLGYDLGALGLAEARIRYAPPLGLGGAVSGQLAPASFAMGAGGTTERPSGLYLRGRARAWYRFELAEQAGLRLTVAPSLGAVYDALDVEGAGDPVSLVGWSTVAMDAGVGLAVAGARGEASVRAFAGPVLAVAEDPVTSGDDGGGARVGIEVEARWWAGRRFGLDVRGRFARHALVFSGPAERAPSEGDPALADVRLDLEALELVAGLTVVLGGG